jgi:hypothetical protein
MIEYVPQIKKIVERYAKIKSELLKLEEQTLSLNLRKNQIEFELSETREAEISLIDKIKIETGEIPDFYKISQGLLEDANVSK